jgi:Inner membrane component of T3SS, cytoplasmic domain
MDKIYFLSGPLTGATAELLGEEITVGRGPDNAICLDDESISDRHALLSRQGDNWVVKDLGSARGTFVRAERVLVAALRDGDKLAFGSVEVEFQAEATKLQLPTSALASATPPAPPQTQTLTWPQPPGSRAKANAPSFKSAVMTVVQLAVAAGILGGSYYAYQKFGHADTSVDASDSAKMTPLNASMPRSYATAAAPAVSTTYSQLAMRPKGEPAPEPVAPATAPAAPAPPPVVAITSSKPPSGAAVPVIQQTKLLLAQNKYADAVTYLDKALASTRDPEVASDLQPPLKQALDAQLLSLQSIKQQWEAQSKPLEDRLKASQDKLEQDNKALTEKKDAEAKIYELPGGHWRHGYWDGHYYYSRTWVPNTRKGTGDPQAQTAIHELQIKVMMDQQDIKKQTDVLSRYHQQILALDQQIAPVQVRVTQLNATLNTAPPADAASAGTKVPQVAMATATVPSVPGVPTSSTPGAPGPEAVPGATAPPAVPAPAPAATPAAAEPDLEQLKPEDWVAGMPDQARSSYLLAQATQEGSAHIEALRHWLSLWSRNMRDPNLTLVELDYLKYVIKYRDPLIIRALEEAKKTRTTLPRANGEIFKQP